MSRIVVAGLSGDSGKTLVSVGLVRAFFQRGLRVAPFKKGPDFIDSAWLGTAATRPGRNLDTFIIPEERIVMSVAQAATNSDIAVVEGNRGLFDGMTPEGSHSTARLAKLIKAPVVLVVDCTKTTRTVAALVLGCRTMDPGLNIAGVVLNRVGTSRQEQLIRKSIALETDVKVLGAIPRLKHIDLPCRHLGLLTAIEHPNAIAMVDACAQAIEAYTDVEGILNATYQVPNLDRFPDKIVHPSPKRARIGILRDAAFSFYYPENLTAIEDAGGELIPISPLTDNELPSVDGVVIGGGFPEVYYQQLSENLSFRADLRRRIDDGLPVWAECGGLMYLSETLIVNGESHEMVGALPITVEQTQKPQGHGYVSSWVDEDNPYLDKGTLLRGHEFHYSHIVNIRKPLKTVLSVERGVGIGDGRDGILNKNVFASYTHIHAHGATRWADGVVSAALG